MKTLIEYFQSPVPDLIGKNALSDALMKLPVDNRLAIVLYFENDLTRKQIAKNLGWSLSKVNQKITRGITLLKLQLNPEYFRQADEIIQQNNQRLLIR